MKTIVVATDGSEQACAALQMAVGIASETGASLCCVSIDDSLATVSVDPEPEKQAKAAAEFAREHGIEAQAVARIGPAAERIRDVAEDCDADLIVVGSHGRGALSGAILGSVSMSLIRESKRPVLVVKSAT
jgi:nucleotide-binding universal stress UspA family protein